MDVGRRERKKRATRAALSEAALRLCLEHGVEHVTIEQISDDADVSARTFFNYFSSKEEAVVAGDSARGEVLVDHFVARPPSESLLTALRSAALAYVESMATDTRRDALQMMRRSPALLPHQLASYARRERALAVAIAQRIGEPVTTDAEGDASAGLHPALVAATTMAGIRVVMQRWSEATPDADTGSVADLRAAVGDVFAAMARGLDDR